MSDAEIYAIAPYVAGKLESITFSGGAYEASFEVDPSWKHILNQCAFLSASGRKVYGVMVGEGKKKLFYVYSVISGADSAFARGSEGARDWVADMRYQISGAVFKFQWMPVFMVSKLSSFTEKRWVESYGGVYRWGPNPLSSTTPTVVLPVA
jgi:hypothetical protein